MTAVTQGWLVERFSGSASELHALDPPVEARRTARVLEVHAPALVLGSTQPDAVVDLVRARRAGVSVARRRSGGGAVLLVPGAQVWFDFFVPVGDPLWDDDIARAAHWVGEAWCRALPGCGVHDLSVHGGGLEASSWSHLVCFAGRGPGEVFSSGRKVVGVSQRRTRHWTRIQTAAHLVWDPERILDLLVLGDHEKQRAHRDLTGRVVEVPVAEASVLTDAVLRVLPA